MGYDLPLKVSHPLPQVMLATTPTEVASKVIWPTGAMGFCAQAVAPARIKTPSNTARIALRMSILLWLFGGSKM
jgi:hypothetical protein